MVTRKAVFISAAAVTTVAAGAAAMTSGPPGFMNAVQGTGDFTLQAARSLKAAGVVTIITVAAVLALRAGAVKLVMIPDNMSGVLCRRGRLVKDRKTGEMVWYESGKVRLHLALYRHIVLVHHGERYSQLGSRAFTVNDMTWQADFTAVWYIPKDADAVEKSLTTVSDRNWWDGEFNQLDRAVTEQSVDLLNKLLSTAVINERTGLPEIDWTSVEATERLAKRGATYERVLMSPVYRPGDQLQKDGLNNIAAAITPKALDD